MLKRLDTAAGKRINEVDCSILGLEQTQTFNVKDSGRDVSKKVRLFYKFQANFDEERG